MTLYTTAPHGMTHAVLAQRLLDRVPPKLLLRIVPKPCMTGQLGPQHRPYVCMADYAELQGLPIREVVRRLYDGFRGDLKALVEAHPGQPFYDLKSYIHGENPCEANLSPSGAFEEGDFHVLAIHPGEALDCTPATWKAMAVIATDPERFPLEHITQPLLDAYKGQRPLSVRDLYSGNIDYYEFESLADERAIRKEQVFYYNYLYKDNFAVGKIMELFGVGALCWHGCGYIGPGFHILSRVFFGKNLSVDHELVQFSRVMSLDDRLPILLPEELPDLGKQALPKDGEDAGPIPSHVGPIAPASTASSHATVDHPSGEPVRSGAGHGAPSNWSLERVHTALERLLTAVKTDKAETTAESLDIARAEIDLLGDSLGVLNVDDNVVPVDGLTDRPVKVLAVLTLPDLNTRVARILIESDGEGPAVITYNTDGTIESYVRLLGVRVSTFLYRSGLRELSPPVNVVGYLDWVDVSHEIYEQHPDLFPLVVPDPEQLEMERDIEEAVAAMRAREEAAKRSVVPTTLNSQAAIARWKEVRPPLPGADVKWQCSVLSSAIREFSVQYLWPLRILVNASGPGEKPRFLILMNWGGHGNDELLWASPDFA